MTIHPDLIFVLPAIPGRLLEQELGMMLLCRKRCGKKVENIDDDEQEEEEQEEEHHHHHHHQTSLLDLPELALDGILRRLPAISLCRMAMVCREFSKRCRSNHLWEVLVHQKWGKVAGGQALAHWQLQTKHRIAAAAASSPPPPPPATPLGSSPPPPPSSFWIWPLSCILPASWMNSCWCRRSKVSSSYTPGSSGDSFMALYWDLESGRFRFPAQVYNRENGHVGFMLSCYDAEMSYNSASDSFLASFSYPPHGPRTSVYEEDVPWERVRAPPVSTSAHQLHASDCLHELKPGDHIEVQWRRNKDFPYGWWYGVVGHDESCSRSTLLCHCHANRKVWLEFNQYSSGSRWRRAPIDRDSHSEEGNDAEGYYGGVRKLRSKEEISIWTKLWPNEKLE